MQIVIRFFLLFLNCSSLILLANASLQKRDDSSRAVGAQPPSKSNVFSKDPKTLLPKGVEPSAGCTKCTSSITFKSKQAQQFQVGTSIPGLSFKTKQSWAGSIAIPDTPTAKGASLFFWLWGKDAVQAGNDLVIWMNGGPGCNSLVGMCTENGPFIFNNNKAEPNPYSWTTAANILYVAQPVGVSFTTGKASNSNELQISQQFTVFLIEFFKVFPELASFNIWLTGESYMGNMAPFQWNAIKQNPQSKNLAMRGGMLVSPLFSSVYTQLEVPVSNFAKENQRILRINDKGLAKIEAESKKCKLGKFLDTHLTYPPRGKIPDLFADCDPFAKYVGQTADRDENFNIYNIENPLVGSSKQPSPVEVFFNQAKVQDYIHAPRQKFQVCTDVFTNGNADQSPPADRYPSFEKSVLGRMFEESERFIVMTGNLDGLLFSQGVQLALQNLTWNGVQGFKNAPSKALYDMEGRKRAIGTNEERNVRLIVVPEGGHMLPRDQPSLTLSALNALLGRGQWLTKKT